MACVLALPHRQHRQLAHHAAVKAYSLDEQLGWDSNCRPS
jgi:hypothetical protein